MPMRIKRPSLNGFQKEYCVYIYIYLFQLRIVYKFPSPRSATVVAAPSRSLGPHIYQYILTWYFVLCCFLKCFLYMHVFHDFFSDIYLSIHIHCKYFTVITFVYTILMHWYLDNIEDALVYLHWFFQWFYIHHNCN